MNARQHSKATEIVRLLLDTRGVEICFPDTLEAQAFAILSELVADYERRRWPTALLDHAERAAAPAHVTLRTGHVMHSLRVHEHVVLDFNEVWRLVGVEILDAGDRVVVETPPGRIME